MVEVVTRDQLFVSTLNRGFFRVKLPAAVSEAFDGAIIISLANAKDAPHLSDSDALTQLNGEPAFLSNDGIARYEIAEDRFVPIASLQSLFRDYLPTRAIVGADDSRSLWMALTPRKAPEGNFPKTRIAQIDSDGRFSFLPAAITRTIGDPTIIEAEPGSGSPILWIAGTYGIARVDTGEKLAPERSFNVFAREASTVSGTSLPLPATGETLTIPFNLSDIQIRFANDRFEGGRPDSLSTQARWLGSQLERSGC